MYKYFGHRVFLESGRRFWPSRSEWISVADFPQSGANAAEAPYEEAENWLAISRLDGSIGRVGSGTRSVCKQRVYQPRPRK